MELISEAVLSAYGFDKKAIEIIQIGSGHINRTFLISTHSADEKFILQEINTVVFKHPEIIASNIQIVANFLKQTQPDYLFPAPLPTEDGALLFQEDAAYWRMLQYVDNTVALETLFEPVQAYEAAKQFGKLSRLLNSCPTENLKATIPGFHDLNLRVTQYKESLKYASIALKETAAVLIDQAAHFHFIVPYYNSFLLRKDFPDRIMHHDTKISNVLLDKQTFKGVCVIDLDTLMPGKFISDLGDMMRTYLCAFSENETDLEKITIRIPYFEATIKGYLSEMNAVLTATEKELLLFSGKYIIYMQALRFLTDYLNGSVYYPVKYPLQNLDRAANQFKLLKVLYNNESVLSDIVNQNL